MVNEESPFLIQHSAFIISEGLDDDGGDVVQLNRGGREVADRLDQRFEDGLRRLMPVRPHDSKGTLPTERLPSRGTGLGNPVGVGKDQITRLQGKRRRRVAFARPASPAPPFSSVLSNTAHQAVAGSISFKPHG
jgi:hypothetical protein